VLHLRVLVPADLSPSVEALLLREPGAVHVSVARDAAREPRGDVIEADVVRAGLGAIISRLEDLHVPERGSTRRRAIAEIQARRRERARIRKPE
jgi:predicted kinase